jgi:WD40 repeat protein
MKVFGQLDAAQLEQVTGTVGLATPTGRVVMDITAPLSAIPKVFNGSSWLPLVLGTAGSAPFSQNSGIGCTVNWANGLIQEVVLTGNCTISFSNPVLGQQHILIVTQNPQAVSALQYSYAFNMIDQDVRRQGAYQPINLQLLPTQNQVFSWYYSTAIKPGYATIPSLISTTNANYLPAVAPTSVAVSPDGKWFTYGTGTTPFGSAIQVIEGAGRPQILPFTVDTAWAAAVTQKGISPDGTVIFATSGTSPFIQAHAGYGAGTGGYGQGIESSGVFANPGALPAGAAQCLDVHPLGAWVAVGHATTPFMSVYPFDAGNSFGTKLTSPGTVPANEVVGIAFSPLGDYLAAICVTTIPYIQVWPFSIAAGMTGAIGTIVAQPGTLPAGAPTTGLGHQLAWRPQGDYIAMVMNTTPYLYVVAFNRTTGAFGATATNSYVPPAALSSVQWTPDGQYLVCGCSSSPFLIVLDFSSGAIGASAVALDGTGIGQAVNDVAVARHGEWVMCALAATPFFKIIPLPTKVRNYLKLNI